MIDRERIESFIDSRRKEILIGCGVLLVTLVIVLVAYVGANSGANKNARRRAASLAASAIKPSDLWMPSEPLPVPGIQRYRDPHATWTVEDARKWYTVPDEKILGELQAASTDKINELLESIP